MKIIFSILILLSISFNTKADHEETLDVDGYEIRTEGIYLYIYNKSQYEISPSDYLWWVAFDDDTKRKYKSSGNWCKPYSDCNFFIKINKKDANNIIDAH